LKEKKTPSRRKRRQLPGGGRRIQDGKVAGNIRFLGLPGMIFAIFAKKRRKGGLGEITLDRR
jgi:hypothetical protein